MSNFSFTSATVRQVAPNERGVDERPACTPLARWCRSELKVDRPAQTSSSSREQLVKKREYGEGKTDMRLDWSEVAISGDVLETCPSTDG